MTRPLDNGEVVIFGWRIRPTLETSKVETGER